MSMNLLRAGMTRIAADAEATINVNENECGARGRY